MRIQQRVDEPLPNPDRPYLQLLRENKILAIVAIWFIAAHIAQATGFLAWLWMWTTTWLTLIVLFWGVELYYLLQ